MNRLILNRETFRMTEDGGYHMAPLGEFPHAGAGVVQMVDEEACRKTAEHFATEAGITPEDKAKAERFAGLLIDFDHFSLDAGRKSEVAGWIVGLVYRGEDASRNGALNAEGKNSEGTTKGAKYAKAN